MIGLVLCTEVVSPLTLSLKGKLATHCDQSNTISGLVIELGAGLYAVCLLHVWYGCIGMVFFVSLCCMLHATYILPLYYGYTQLQAVLDVLPLLQWFVYMVIAPQISVFVQKQGMKRNRIWNPLLASCWGICVIFTFFRLCNDKKVARCQWRETLHFTLYTKHHSNMCAWS